MMALKRLLVRVDLAGIGFVLGVTEETVLGWLKRAAHHADAINRHLLRALPVALSQISHSIGFSGGHLSSYVEGSSALDFLLIHDAQSQDHL